MYKSCFLMGPGDDPFRYEGSDAADAVRSRFPDICGYVQTRSLDGPEPPAFSGYAELLFEHSAPAIEACVSGITALLADSAEMHATLAGRERVVVRTAAYITADRIKGVYPFRKRPDLTVDDFQHHWWHTHGPIAALTEDALSYVQIHALPDAYETVKPAFDGITEISWPDLEAAGRAIVSRQMREDQGSDAPNFVDMESILLFMAKEEIVIEP